MANPQNCGVSPNKSFLSSTEWILTPLVTHLGWGPEGPGDENWSCHPFLLVRVIPKLSLKEKIKSQEPVWQPPFLGRLWVPYISVLPWGLMMILKERTYVGCLSLSAWPLEFSESLLDVGQSHVIPGLIFSGRCQMRNLEDGIHRGATSLLGIRF